MVETLGSMMARGKKPDILFWVGCAGSFDERAQKTTKALATIFQQCNLTFAVLGEEESCTGDPAKRSGNEFLFQLQALKNIEVLNRYQVTDIVTACPHCFNTLKNEYPELGGRYKVFHHSQYLVYLIKSGKLKLNNNLKGKAVTFHDPCYLGRANGEYEMPREILRRLGLVINEMTSSRQQAMCCGAGGAQMFKEPEQGHSDINTIRCNQAAQTKSEILVVACPFCKVMMDDGVKQTKKNIETKDIAELITKN